MASFNRGAHLGGLVAGLVIMLTLITALEMTGAEASPADASAATALRLPAFTSIVATTGRATQSMEQEQPVAVGDQLFELAVELQADVAEAAEATPEAIATPEALPVPVRAVAPPLIVAGDQLYAILEATFPEDPDHAYAIVMCESSGNATANTGNGYYGMWQFDLATWQSVGGTGLPSDATVAEQMTRARLLYDARGWSPWGCRQR